MKIAVKSRTLTTTLQKVFIIATAGIILPISLFALTNRPTQAADGDVPLVVSSTAGSGALAIGGGHVCAIGADELVYCMGGAQQNGVLGDGRVTGVAIKYVAVDTSGVLAGKTIKTVATGDEFACVIASDDQVYCWGENQYGQLGNNSSGTVVPSPVAVDTSGVLAGKTIKALSLGGTHACVIASDDQVYCWGANWSGRIGNNSTVDTLAPVAVDTSGVLAGKTMVAVSSASEHTCAVDSDGAAYCWGLNNKGQLGTNSTLTTFAPVAVNMSGALAGKTIKSISAGRYHTCAIASDNQVYCWGSNENGRLGNNSTADSLVPVAVDTSGVLAGKTVEELTARDNFSCVIASDKRVYCWGANQYGQLGDGTLHDASAPAAVDTSGALAGLDIAEIDSRTGTTCATAIDRSVYCWGGNSPVTSQKKFGDTSVLSWPPTQMLFTFISTGTVVAISFTTIEGEPVAIVEGQNFGLYTDMFDRSMVMLNGEALPLCVLHASVSAEDLIASFGIPPELVTNNPACALVFDMQTSGIVYTDTSALIWLPSDFDITAPGTVSVNNSEPFAFNQPTGAPVIEGDESPTVAPPNTGFLTRSLDHMSARSQQSSSAHTTATIWATVASVVVLGLVLVLLGVVRSTLKTRKLDK